MRIAIPLLLICMACGKPSGSEGGNSVKFEQYFVRGEQVYAQHCSNCHQKSGAGLGRVYPPVNKSDFIDDHLDEVICLIRHGRQGEIVVNGKMFNQAMPPTTLSDLEIAEVVTYIYNNWDRKHGIVEVNSVATFLQKCDSIPAKH
jgi:cytochrome c551